MPLSVAKIGMVSSINSAYQNSKNLGIQDGANSDAIISQLALELSSAIHTYMLQALVQTNDTINPGQPDIPIGGFTVSPGTGTGIGNLL